MQSRVSSMRKSSILNNATNGCFFLLRFFLLIFSWFFIQTTLANSQSALNQDLILSLREGHSETCIPAVTNQLVATGLNFLTPKAGNYCDCVGIFYFNDLTRAEYDEMIRGNGRLPQRIEVNRRLIQEHCADVHFN